MKHFSVIHALGKQMGGKHSIVRGLCVSVVSGIVTDVNQWLLACYDVTPVELVFRSLTLSELENYCMFSDNGYKILLHNQ